MGGEIIDPVLVTVNTKSLTRSEADEIIRGIAGQQGVPPQMMGTFLQQAGAQLQQQAVSQFIDQTLADGEIARRDITVSDEEVNAVIEEITGSLPAGMTIDQALASRQMTLEQLQSEIREGEKRRKLFEAETEAVPPPTDEEVATFYNENGQYFEKEASAPMALSSTTA